MKKIFFLLLFSSITMTLFAKSQLKKENAGASCKVEFKAVPDLKMLTGCTKIGQTPSPYYDDMVVCSATAATCEAAQNMVNMCLLATLFDIP
ncbi:MAG: hypothetical protein ABL872_18550 [Lacibacter sp.]